MRTASSNMAAHLAGEVTSLAVCWKLTLVDGTVMGFTDHTSDLTVSSQLYKAATGFSPTSVETKDKFSVDNLDVAGILDAAAISKQVHSLASGDKSVCLSAANDWLNLHETEDSAHKTRRWLYEQATPKQLQYLPPQYQHDYSLTRYEASALMTLKFNQRAIKQAVGAL